MPEPVATTTAAPAQVAPTAPTPTKTPTAEELAAAISGQQQAAPAAAQPKYRYEVAPNVVYQGDDLEAVVDQMVKAQKSANEHIQTLQTENRQFRTAQQPRDDAGRFAAQQAATAGEKFNQQEYFNRLTEDPLSAQRMALAALFNIPEDQVVDTLNRTVKAAGMAADNLLVTSFFTECPEFPYQDADAMKALVEMVDSMGGVYTPKSMKAAHRLCVDENKYTPVQTIGAAETTRPTPMPVPTSGGASEPAQDYMAMAERMTPAQIREAIARLEAGTTK